MSTYTKYKPAMSLHAQAYNCNLADVAATIQWLAAQIHSWWPQLGRLGLGSQWQLMLEC